MVKAPSKFTGMLQCARMLFCSQRGSGRLIDRDMNAMKHKSFMSASDDNNYRSLKHKRSWRMIIKLPLTSVSTSERGRRLNNALTLCVLISLQAKCTIEFPKGKLIKALQFSLLSLPLMMLQCCRMATALGSDSS